MLETVAVTEEVAVEEEVKEEIPTLHLTHEIAAGENLWKLAVQYLSAGKRWPEIYELNREKYFRPRFHSRRSETPYPIFTGIVVWIV